MTAPGRRPGEVAGPGWPRRWLEVLPAAEVDGVWVFQPLRRERPGSGVPRSSRRVDGDRRRIYTARYVLAIKGKERGKFEASVEEVGSGPVEALEELLGASAAGSTTSTRRMPVPRRRVARGRARWRASVVRRRPASSSASAVTSAITASRSPASATWSPGSCSCPRTISRSKPSSAGSGRSGERSAPPRSTARWTCWSRAGSSARTTSAKASGATSRCRAQQTTST